MLPRLSDRWLHTHAIAPVRNWLGEDRIGANTVTFTETANGARAEELPAPVAWEPGDPADRRGHLGSET